MAPKGKHLESASSNSEEMGCRGGTNEAWWLQTDATSIIRVHAEGPREAPSAEIAQANTIHSLGCRGSAISNLSTTHEKVFLVSRLLAGVLLLKKTLHAHMSCCAVILP